MPQKFKTVKTGDVFFDLQARTFFKKRDDETAAMLHHGKDLGFDGDAFDKEDMVYSVDMETMQKLPLTHTINIKSDCLSFSGTVADALVYLEELNQTCNATENFVKLSAVAEHLKTALKDVSTLTISEQTE